MILKQLKLNYYAILIALGAATIYPGFVYNINRMLTEQLFKTLLLLFVFLFLKGIYTDNRKILFLSAFVIGYATLVRGVALPIFLIALIILAILYVKPRRNVIFFSTGFLLTQIPWWIRNFLVAGQFICKRPILMRSDTKLPQPFAGWSNSL